MSRAKPYFTPVKGKPNQWTVMIYMAGDNDLDNFGISDLREIKRVGSSDQVQIIAEFDRSGPDHLTKRYWLRNHEVAATLRDDVLEEFDETDSGSPEQLTNFIKWGMEQFPAEHYFLILWAHGAGAYDEDPYYTTGTRLRPRIPQRGIFSSSRNYKPIASNAPGNENRVVNMRLIAPDDQARSFIDNVELKRALQNALPDVKRRIDILGMDACLMSMVEVCYQLRECADIIVSSEAQEPLEGWPYEAFLRPLVQKPEMTSTRISEIIVDEFVKLYHDYENSTTTLAACDVSKCEELIVPLFRDLANCLLTNMHDPKVVDAVMLTRYIVQSDEVIETVDLYDFCEILRGKCNNEAVVNCCEQVMREFKKSGAVVTQPLVGGAAHWHGLSFYFPTAEVSRQYQNLDLIQGSLNGWKEFIDRYVAISGR